MNNNRTGTETFKKIPLTKGKGEVKRSLLVIRRGGSIKKDKNHDGSKTMYIDINQILKEGAENINTLPSIVKSGEEPNFSESKETRVILAIRKKSDDWECLNNFKTLSEPFHFLNFYRTLGIRVMKRNNTISIIQEDGASIDINLENGEISLSKTKVPVKIGILSKFSNWFKREVNKFKNRKKDNIPNYTPEEEQEKGQIAFNTATTHSKKINPYRVNYSEHLETSISGKSEQNNELER